MKFNPFILVALVITMLISCNKNELNEGEQGSLSFGATSSQLKSENSAELKNVTHVILTITKDGKVYKDFNLKSVKLNSWGGSSFTTEDVKLEVGGGYKLEHFELQSSDKKTLFAAPVTGSALASKVSKPLSIGFEIKSNERTNVVVEVLSTVKTTPADFGYAYFTIKVPGNKYRLKKKETTFTSRTEPTMKYEYFYDKDGKLDYFMQNTKNKWVCKYDSDGKLTEEVYNINLKNKYVYNDKDQKTEYIRGLKPSGSYYNKHTYEYEDGKLVNEYIHTGKGVFVEKIHHYEFVHMPKQQIFKKDDKGELYVHAHVFFKFDENWNISTGTKYLESSTDKSFSVTRYYYELVK